MRGRSESVTFGELRRILRLVGDLRDLPPGSLEQQRCTLQGLCDLVGAQLGLWLRLTLTHGDRILVSGAVDLGWNSESQRRAYLSYLDAQPRSVDPTHAPLAHLLRGQPFTAARRQVLQDRAWYRSEHVQEFRRAGGVDDFMYCGQMAKDGVHAHGLSLHRPWGDRPFSERERLLVETFQVETAWLYDERATVDPDVLENLPPRLRDVLVRLVNGLGEKQVASELGLSPHTVHDYVKALYHRLGVGSRGELLSQFIGRRPTRF